MDPLHWCIALGPLAAYLLLIGLINLSRRPFVTTGARDLSALSVGVCGFFVVGPMELFLPAGAISRFGGFAWLLLIGLYALSVSLVVLLARPRLVLYNIVADQLRPILADLVSEMDQEARWAGDTLVLPRLGIQLYLETNPALRNVQLVALGAQQNYESWKRLEEALSTSLRQVQSRPSLYGLSLLLASTMVMGIIFSWALFQRQAVAQALIEMLRL